MTTLELQSEYQSLVSRIANEDYETISKAVNALKKILSPNKDVQDAISADKH